MGNVPRADGADALHLRCAEGDGGGKADGAADRRGVGQVGHYHLHTGAVQAQGDTGGDVARPANENQHSLTSVSLFPQ